MELIVPHALTIMDVFRQLSRFGRAKLRPISQIPPRQVFRALLPLAAHLIFWGWNSLFLMVVYLGFLPWIGVPLVMALATGEVPFPFVVPLVSFLTVPPVCSIFGLLKLRKQPQKLMRLFYSVEAPIMALSLLRMFVLRELTPASTVMVLAGAIAIASVTLELVFGYAAYSKPLARFQMMAHTIMLAVGAYVGSLLLFYTVPLLWVGIKGFFSFQWIAAAAVAVARMFQSAQFLGPIDLLGWLFTWGLTTLLVLGVWGLVGVSVTLFLTMPLGLVVTFAQSWGRIRHAFSQQFGHRQTWVAVGLTGVMLAGLWGLTSPQPQTQVLAMLNQPPASPAARQALVQRSAQIRRGLLNAYLMQYRYISTVSSANNLESWYPHVMPITTAQAQRLQRWHNTLLSPFLYRGDRTDPEQAATRYADFFDMPIQKGESAAIKHALQSTVERDSVEASLLNIDDRLVSLARQEVTVKPNGDWAAVTLYERYENFTADDQEIVYQFSLPESAVFTELWLGEGDLAERYRFVVSPRGAAQQVYQQEIERTQIALAEDPALLEQVGPQQYRLRVFPIPRRQFSRPGVTHLWMTYQVSQQDGAWPLPQLTEKRNLYWTDQTERLRLGQPWQPATDVWYETAIPATTRSSPQAHQTTLAEGYAVTATPLSALPAPILKQQRLAVLVDTSRSMADRTSELRQALQQMTAIDRTNTVDWYITSAAGMAPQKLTSPPDIKAVSFYGSIPLTDQLNQWDRLRAGVKYDAIFVLTDAGNYELESDRAAVPQFSGALWLVHLGEAVPPAYADELQQRLSDSQGGVSQTLATAIARFATERQTGYPVMDGYQWAIAPAEPVASESAFDPVAARQVIRWLSRHQDTNLVETLDQLHAIAKRTEIVTPYSSMLVLVNERQREALKAAENDPDRFKREVENGEDTLTNPGDPLNASVPEGDTVLGLLLMGSLMLGLIGRSHYQTWRQRRHP